MVNILSDAGIIITCLLTVVTIIISYTLYRLSFQGPKLAYHARSSVIIDKASQSIPDELKIYSGMDELNDLIKTSFYLWNCGYKCIKKLNLHDKDKLRIEFAKGTKIYHCHIVNNTDPGNEFFIDKQPLENIIPIQLEYLERKDGVRIDVLHSKTDTEPKVLGKLIESKKGLINSKDLFYTKYNSFTDKLAVFSLYTLLISVSFLVMFGIMSLNEYFFKYDWITILGFVEYPLVPAVLAPIILKHFSKSKKYPVKLDLEGK
ncbi:MAG: hypothetical protein K0R34_2440 [Herbinix sp.]|jgi:hypothetical protein|nr:hypothetical protein [Herbinix sp.]